MISFDSLGASHIKATSCSVTRADLSLVGGNGRLTSIVIFVLAFTALLASDRLPA